MEAKQILELLRDRIQRESLPQRQVAEYLGVSQGHLSKVLASQVPVSKKFAASARWWLGAAPARLYAVNDGEEALLLAARKVAHGSERVMHLMADVMHQVHQAGLIRRRSPVDRSRAEADGK